MKVNEQTHWSTKSIIYLQLLCDSFSVLSTLMRFLSYLKDTLYQTLLAQ